MQNNIKYTNTTVLEVKKSDTGAERTFVKVVE